MSDLTVSELAQFLTIMLYVLVAGVMWGTWLSLARTMTRYDAPTFLADGKHMISNLATIMAVLMISAAVVGLGVVVLLFRRRSTVAASSARNPAWPMSPWTYSDTWLLSTWFSRIIWASPSP